MKSTWKEVDEEGMRVGLSREDALCPAMLIVGITQIAVGFM